MACTNITTPYEHKPPVYDELRPLIINILLITSVTGINILFLFLKKLIRSTAMSPLCTLSALNDKSKLSINDLFFVRLPFLSYLLRSTSTFSTGTTAVSINVVLTTYWHSSRFALMSFSPRMMTFLFYYLQWNNTKSMSDSSSEIPVIKLPYILTDTSGMIFLISVIR